MVFLPPQVVAVIVSESECLAASVTLAFLPMPGAPVLSLTSFGGGILLRRCQIAVGRAGIATRWVQSAFRGTAERA